MNTKQVDFSLRLALQDGEPCGALFAKEEIAGVAENVTEARDRIERGRGKGPLAFLELPYSYGSSDRRTAFGDTFSQTLGTIHEAANRIRAARGQFVHVGIGGSALGAITLVTALGVTKSMGYECPAEIHVPDNVDPDWIGELLHRLDLTRVYANVVSKSGDTTETIATFALLLEVMREKSNLSPAELRRRIFVTTNPEEGALAELARSEGFTILPLPDAIHGRFSVFSPMGLLAAAVAGIDVGELLEGARVADERTARAPFGDNPSLQFAALHYVGLTQKGISNLILLPYSNRLRTVGDWYSQLVAESLGKQGQGMTPVKALGVTDQHSQLQLYIDGPKDKLVVVFSVARHAETLRIPNSLASNSAYTYLAYKTFNDLFKAEREATEVSLHLHGVPNCRFELAELSPFNMGYLLTVLEKTVCILGELLSVNAFDQPGVEESKEYARAMLGKSGEQYDQLREIVAKLSK